MAGAIQLYVYDLSKGMALVLGEQLTGNRIDGIWHTSIVVFGIEASFGQGIEINKPGATHHGTPNRILPMGDTALDRSTFLEYIEGLREVYLPEKYHLLDFNCNSFTNEVLQFINGRSIPDYIRNLPAEIMATPFGRSMRPMIDQMFSGQGQSIPSASAAVSALVPDNAITTATAPVTHPHSKLNLPALARLSQKQKLAPINYSILPAPAALVLRIEGSLDRAAMTSDRHSAVTKSKQVLLKQVIPYLMNGLSGTFPMDFIENWIKATREGFAILPIGEVFPIVDLFRIAFSKDAVRLETAVGYVIDGSPDSLLRTILLLCEGEETPRGLMLTVLRFTSNALASPLLASLLLTPGSDRTSLTLLVIKSLLHEDPLVRATGSGLVFGVVGRLYDSKENRGGMRGGSATDEEEEEWEVEIASAVLEALEREDASVEVVHRLAATLGLLLYYSPLHEPLAALLDALGARMVLESKLEALKENKEAIAIVKELGQLLV